MPRRVEAYLALRGSGVGPLFLASSPQGQLKEGVALRPSGLKQMLRRLGRKTGIAKVHAHRFRHTFATWAIEHGARELDVQYLLGHSSPDMVRRYSSRVLSDFRPRASQARDLVIERAAVRLGEGCLAAPDGAGLYVVV